MTANQRIIVKYGPTGTEYAAQNCSVVVDHTTLRCLTVEGVGTPLRWVVDVDGLTSRTPTTSYARPSIRSASLYELDSGNGSARVVTEAPTVGGTQVVVEGDNFGAFAEPLLDLKLQYGDFTSGGTVQFATDCTLVAEHTKMMCKLVAGVGRGLQLQVSVAGQMSDLSESAVTVAYRRPTVTRVVTPSGEATFPTAGGPLAIVTGTGFGPASARPIVRFGLKADQLDISTISDAVTPHTRLQFELPPGHGSGVELSVIAGNQTSWNSSVPTVSRYTQPTLVNMEYIDGSPCDLPIRVRLTGLNLGHCCYCERMRLAGQPVSDSCLGTETKPCVCLALDSPDRKEAVLLHDAVLHTTECSGDGTPAAPSPSPSPSPSPGLSNVTTLPVGPDGATNHSSHNTTIGGSNSTWSGRRMLQPAHDRTRCVIESLTDTEIVCEMFVVSATVQLRMGGQVSSSNYTYSYEGLLNRPVIRTLTPSSGPTAGGYNVTLTGTNFGTATPLLSLQYHSTTGELQDSLVQVSDYGSKVLPPSILGGAQEDRLVFIMPPGQGVLLVRVLVFSGQADTSLTDEITFTFDTPIVTNVGYRDNVLPPTLPKTGLHELQVYGVHFGVPGVDVNEVLVGGLRCPTVQWSDDRITCTPPAGTGSGLPVAVRVFRRTTDRQFTHFTSTGNSTMDYARPAITALWRCGSTEIASCFQTQATAGLGVQALHPSAVPALTAVSRQTSPTVGGVLVAIEGVSFGQDAGGRFNIGPPQSSVRLLTSTEDDTLSDAGVTVDVVRWSHGLVVIRSPPGCGANLRLLVSVNELRSDISALPPAALFSYEQPVITSVSVASGALGPSAPAVTSADALDTTPSGPARFSALESALVIYGTNFGTCDPQVSVGDVSCNQVIGSAGSVTCGLGVVPTGWKRVRVAVDGLPAAERRGEELDLRALCPSGYFGGEQNASCALCPRCVGAKCPAGGDAAVCDGGALPTAQQGFWLSARAGSSVSILLCEPPEACDANNTCAVGYSGAVCVQCIKGYYRDPLGTNQCVQCPENSSSMLIGMAVGILVGAFVLYHLYRKGPSVAAIGIAIDYFQILAIFGSLDLNWPGSVKFVFSALSLFSSNVEVTAPECSVAVNYFDKWLFTMAIPVLIAGAGCVGICFLFLFAMFTAAGRRSAADRFQSRYQALIGFVLLMLNFMYILLLKKSLEVFECTEVDGEMLLAVDSEVACSGEQYELMKKAALVGSIVYGAGIPLLFIAIVTRYRSEMREEQAVRISGQADSRATNQFYDFQKKFKRLYYKFKPETFFWLLVIMVRKFCVVFIPWANLNRPMFAATAVTFMLFGCYVLHQKFLPYRDVANEGDTDPDKAAQATLVKSSDDPQSNSTANPMLKAASTSKAAKLLLGLDAGKAKALPLKHIKHIRVGSARTEHGVKKVLFQGRGGKGAIRVETSSKSEMKVRLRYLYDHNMLEGTFLMCAIFLLLAGIAFKSAEFNGGAEKTAIEIIVFVIVIASTLACLVTVAAELWQSVLYYIRALRAAYGEKVNRLRRRFCCARCSGVSQRSLASSEQLKKLGVATSTALTVQNVAFAKGRGALAVQRSSRSLGASSTRASPIESKTAGARMSSQRSGRRLVGQDARPASGRFGRHTHTELQERREQIRALRKAQGAIKSFRRRLSRSVSNRRLTLTGEEPETSGSPTGSPSAPGKKIKTVFGLCVELGMLRQMQTVSNGEELEITMNVNRHEFRYSIPYSSGQPLRHLTGQFMVDDMEHDVLHVSVRRPGRWHTDIVGTTRIPVTKCIPSHRPLAAIFRRDGSKCHTLEQTAMMTGRDTISLRLTDHSNEQVGTIVVHVRLQAGHDVCRRALDSVEGIDFSAIPTIGYAAAALKAAGPSGDNRRGSVTPAGLRRVGMLSSLQNAPAHVLAVLELSRTQDLAAVELQQAHKRRTSVLQQGGLVDRKKPGARQLVNRSITEALVAHRLKRASLLNRTAFPFMESTAPKPKAKTKTTAKAAQAAAKSSSPVIAEHKANAPATGGGSLAAVGEEGSTEGLQAARSETKSISMFPAGMSATRPTDSDSDTTDPEIDFDSLDFAPFDDNKVRWRSNTIKLLDGAGSPGDTASAGTVMQAAPVRAATDSLEVDDDLVEVSIWDSLPDFTDPARRSSEHEWVANPLQRASRDVA